MKIKVKGTRPSKINVKGTVQLFWILKGHFHEIQLLGAIPSKIMLNGKIITLIIITRT